MNIATVPLWKNLQACLLIHKEVTSFAGHMHVTNPSTPDGGTFTLIKSSNFYISVYPDGAIRIECTQWAEEIDGRGLLFNLGYRVGEPLNE